MKFKKITALLVAAAMFGMAGLTGCSSQSGGQDSSSARQPSQEDASTESGDLLAQIQERGEIVIATSESRFKRVIAAQIDPLPRYRKGVQIASLKGAKVIFANYVTVPYMLAVVTQDDTMTELSTEEIPIDATNTRGRTLKGVKWKAQEVYAMRYREAEES